MGGGLMQLVAYGAQDIYLTGNPQITFFKVVYRRHTNFSMEAIKQTFNGNASVTGSTMTATISRNGDLVSNLWLDVVLKSGGMGLDNGFNILNWTNNTGHAFVKECEVEIGGQRIDRHYSQWLDIWNEVSDHDKKEWHGLNKHADKGGYLTDGVPNVAAPDNLQLYVPLKFWFCRNPGLALPLIALQYHEVNIKIITRNINALVNRHNPTAAARNRTLGTVNPVVELWADYIYLDTDERRRFAQVSHEYLIEQLQRVTGSTTGAAQKNITLNYNHPVKELLWVIQDKRLVTENLAVGGAYDSSLNTNGIRGGSDTANNNDYFTYLTHATPHAENIFGTSAAEGFTTMKLKLNGHDRFKERKASYFRTCQMIQSGHRVPTKHIYGYSFALKPEEHQPSGTCNFSRIDNAQMVFGAVGGTSAATISVYAVNYNVLRIMSGMGGLAYSN
jgi:hypothetical protein